MKSTNILLLSFLMLFASCAVYEKYIDNNMYISNAGYSDWSKAPNRGDVPEKGTDLAVIVKNWPEGAAPQHIVFEGHQSLGAEIDNRNESRVVINARIIRATTKLPQTSKEVDLSDRLVYTDEEGNEKYLRIEEWTNMDNEN